MLGTRASRTDACSALPYPSPQAFSSDVSRGFDVAMNDMYTQYSTEYITDGIRRTNMVRFRSGIARCRRLPGRVSGLAMAIGLLVAACSPAHTAATGAATAHGTARPSSSASPPPSSAADCGSARYTAPQLDVASPGPPL